MQTAFTLPFNQISRVDLPKVGGKGANLGEMTRAGFPVPTGFCITTDAFWQFMRASEMANTLYAMLDRLQPDDIENVREVGQQVRERLHEVPIPLDVKMALLTTWKAQGSEHAYAVRSSATAEDLPDASFAGQQDTYLNVRGQQALLDCVRSCWISLFTDRAILYRSQNGFSHRDVSLSVVVQQMVFPEISGLLFTADPVSGHRQVMSIDASYGLGEALVSGLVSADLYKVGKRDQSIVETRLGDKQIAIRPNPEGGTLQEDVSEDLRTAQVLRDDQIRQLADLGRRIEEHYGSPQDIEWCIADDQVYIVQARPITSLFPLPEPYPTDDGLHVYFSFSHAQVMTDPMPPIAHSVWRILFPFGKPKGGAEYNPYIKSAGGRIYIDPSPLLRHPLFQRLLPKALENADQLIAQTVRQVIGREAFQAETANLQDRASTRGVARWILPLMLKAQTRLWWYKPEGATDILSTHADTYIRRVQAELASATPGGDRLKSVRRLLGTIFVEGVWNMPPFLVAGMLARHLIMRLTQKYGDPGDIVALTRGLSGNATTEMDLAVGDLADVARQSPELIHHLTTQDPVTALKTAADVPGGEAFMTAWNQFLDRFGMRGPSEIDISRPRWREKPASLLQVVVGNLQHGEAGRHREQHQRLVTEGDAAGERLVAAAQYGVFGFLRAAIVRRLVRVTRNLLPIREHPKLLLVRALDLVKQIILEAAETLKGQGRIDDVNDVWFLDLTDLIDLFEQPIEDLRDLIAQRKADFARYQKMIPPRVMTSEGEIPVVQHTGKDMPDGALPGNSVSAGVVEGLAKVVLDPNTDLLSPGEILVAPFTDPGWTPLFINAAGLVMEVGGVMTHGSVVAREYGIPAVVGVLNATQIIKTGQRIRVEGDSGYVEILEDVAHDELGEASSEATTMLK